MLFSLSKHDVKMLTKKLGFNKKSHPIFSKDIIEEE